MTFYWNLWNASCDRRQLNFHTNAAEAELGVAAGAGGCQPLSNRQATSWAFVISACNVTCAVKRSAANADVAADAAVAWAQKKPRK